MVWLVISVIYASKITPPNVDQIFLPDSEKIVIALKKINEFTNSKDDEQLMVNILWGLKGINKEGIDKYDTSDLGKLIWDDNFDITEEHNQVRLFDICEVLKNSPLIFDNEITCFLYDFKAFLAKKSVAFPVKKNDFVKELKLFAKTNAGVKLERTYSFGIIEDKVRFINVKVFGKRNARGPAPEMNIEFQKWEDLVKGFNKNSKNGLNNAIQTAGRSWAWIVI